MTLKTDIDQIAVDAGLLHDIVHGGPTAVVATEGGAVRSAAKAIADLEALIVTEAGSYVDQCQDEVALATAQAQTATSQAAAAAGSALSAASVVSQDLSAIDRTVFSATLVDCFLYDTSKDIDGGAWRKRCAHTSWENETLSGNWLGSAANETAARLISGATTGSYYYDTTALVFRSLNAGSGVTQVYRGNVRQFPAQVLITAESKRVIIWDITQAGCPMWMVFVGDGSDSTLEFLTSTSVTSVSMMNGILVVGTFAVDVSYYGHPRLCKFVSDRVEQWNGFYAVSTVGVLPISGRNGNLQFSPTYLANYGQTISGLFDGRVIDFAITVLPKALVEVSTRLPGLTIAFAVAGNDTYNVIVVKDTYTAINISADTAGTSAVGVGFDGISLVAIRSDGNVYVWNDARGLTTGLAASATLSDSTTPALLGTVSKLAKNSFSSSTGLTLLIRNQLALASSLVAYITKDYNSGWLPGDIRAAWLADTVAETVTGTELITNGTFDTDATGWTAVGGAGLGVASGELTVTNAGAVAGGASQAVTTVVGKTYVASLTARKGTAATVYLNVGTASGGSTLGSVSTTSASNVPLMKSFVATATTTYITGATDATDGGTGIFDNVSCRLADVDRSVKAKGLQVFGSLTKADYASGAQLMGYSGFSAANYLEQPYNSDLDFGTGDFCIMGWLTEAPNSAIEYLFNRDSLTPGKAIRIWVAAAGHVVFQIFDGTTTRTATSGRIIDAPVVNPVMICCTYRAGTLTGYISGVAANGMTATGAALLTLNNADAVTRVGCDVAGSYPATNAKLALWRASATVPSAEQIAFIYEQERPLFNATTQCCLAGTSNAVTALAYDEDTDLLHVGTSYGRSAFKGLVRVASEATPVGSIVAIAAGAGIVAQAGATAVDVYVPAYLLREELLRDAEQMARFGQNLIAHDFTATASQTTFALPVGWEIVAVYQQGALKRETTSWTRSFDGFVWSVVLGTGATVSDWISILAKRV